MSWRRVLKSVQGVAAHTLLLCFTLLLVLKLDHVVSYSWWSVFLSFSISFFFFFNFVVVFCGCLIFVGLDSFFGILIVFTMFVALKSVKKIMGFASICVLGY